jgi:hypothetical protein
VAAAAAVSAATADAKADAAVAVLIEVGEKAVAEAGVPDEELIPLLAVPVPVDLAATSEVVISSAILARANEAAALAADIKLLNPSDAPPMNSSPTAATCVEVEAAAVALHASIKEGSCC